jgi:hypothetical protein
MRKKGDKEKKTIIDDNNCVKELKILCYVPAHWLPGFEPTEDKMRLRFPIPKWKGPLVKAHFLGLQEDPNSQYPKQIGPLNPDWIKHFFKGVFVHLVMLKPNHWWPMVIGSARHGEDEKAPEELLVSKIKIKYPQHELDQCFIHGVVSSFYYWGLTQVSCRLCDTAHTFEWLTKTFALKELKNVMQEYAPCIGVCKVYNVCRKNKKSKKLSKQDKASETNSTCKLTVLRL